MALYICKHHHHHHHHHYHHHFEHPFLTRQAHNSMSACCYIFFVAFSRVRITWFRIAWCYNYEWHFSENVTWIAGNNRDLDIGDPLSGWFVNIMKICVEFYVIWGIAVANEKISKWFLEIFSTANGISYFLRLEIHILMRSGMFLCSDNVTTSIDNYFDDSRQGAS